MKVLDVIILLAVIWFAIRGFKKGFIGELFSLLALIIGGWATVHLTDYTCSLLHWDNPDKWLLAAGITFMAVVVIVLLVGKLCKSVFNFVLPEFFDKLLGLVFGGGKVIVLVGILFYFVSNVDMQERILTADRKSSSFFYRPSLKVAEFLLPQFDRLKQYHFKFNKKEDIVR
ncbi:MAG: CvpA family protein [Bacteroidales bacterium]|jgi:membrane protein required for colicin V production|nr:CvpA family protein [Bacteroidales bacterium]